MFFFLVFWVWGGMGVCECGCWVYHHVCWYVQFRSRSRCLFNGCGWPIAILGASHHLVAKNTGSVLCIYNALRANTAAADQVLHDDAWWTTHALFAEVMSTESRRRLLNPTNFGHQGGGLVVHHDLRTTSWPWPQKTKENQRSIQKIEKYMEKP